MTPVRAIRAYCVSCSGDNVAEVRKCVIPDCPLYDFRMGTNPNRKGLGGNVANLHRPAAKKRRLSGGFPLRSARHE